LSQGLKILKTDGGFIDEAIHAIICEDFKRTPNPTNSINDYGVILTPKDINLPKGFGFSLKLGQDDLKGKTVEVSGYRVASEPGLPKTSSGYCTLCRPDQLEYDATTEQGNSGSPVFIPYNGHEAAVAIQ
jgi:V8-like Glu-specific endopeptidase